MLLDDLASVAHDFRHRPARRFAEALPDAMGGRPGAVRPAADALPAELAFLAAQGISGEVLARASRAAEAAGVTGEAALFGLGFADDLYYRLLARHLGVPTLERPLPLARGGVDRRACSAAGSAPLTPNPGDLASVMAPRGLALRSLVADHSFADRGRYGFAVTTPRRLDALLRRHDAAGLCEDAACGLSHWDAALSARGGATPRQLLAAFALLVVAAFAFGAAPGAAWLALSVLLLVVFAGAVAQRLLVVAASLPPAAHPPAPAPDADLPVYTLIVPLFREARILPQLVRNLDALDYPPAKLDIKIMLEEGDRATQEAAARLGLPVRYDVIVLPDGHPRTKPRALNAALEAARGDLVVVYDAEDRPDPGQLRAAAARFAAGPGSLACLQARLTVDHADECWIARMFAFDYAALFHVVKPGLAALGLPIPLGGTSNHFRASALRLVGGWDAWNVTEDIDLGFRLARLGFAVGSLDSDTFEEAPLTLARWMPQRSRWLKGWMVTLLVHGRHPRRLFRELGWRCGLSVALSLSGTVLSCLAGAPLLGVVLVEACRGTLFRPETPLWWLSVAAAAVLLAGGAAAVLWPVVGGLGRMGRRDLAPWIVTLPLYLLLVSVAAWRALFELWRDPQRWNKTEHGVARRRAGGDPAVRNGRPVAR